MSSGFKNEGDEIYLVGFDRAELGCSDYLKVVHNTVAGDAPDIDIEKEKLLYKFILEANNLGLIASAHDCSEGGLAVALAEKSIDSADGLACKVIIGKSSAELFGESQSRIVVSIDLSKSNEFNNLASILNIPVKLLGKVQKDSFEIGNVMTATVADLRQAYEGALPAIMTK